MGLFLKLKRVKRKKKMPKYNENIKLLLSSGKIGDVPQYYSAFNLGSESKEINGLFKRLVLPNRYKYPIARVYVNRELKYSYIQGVLVDNKFSESPYYGADISLYKLKLILIKDNEFTTNFYSNSFIENPKMQLKALLEQYCKGIYKNKFISALIYDINLNALVFKIIYSPSTKKYKVVDDSNKIINLKEYLNE